MPERVVAWIFVAVQAVLIVLIVVLPSEEHWPLPTALEVLARVLFIGGLAVVALGAGNLGRSLTPLPTPVASGALRTNGLYRWVRHPIYSGVIAAMAGVALRSRSIWVAVLTVALTVWFTLKARWEEARLAERFAEYPAYAARTPRFVPRPWRRIS